jgi:uncharacterized membrane-anchored protein
MSTGTTRSPNLPIAPVEYNQQYQDQLNNVLRLYFAQLDNPGPSAASTQRNGNVVISALNFSQANATGARVVSLPTQADLANITVGSVYVDTSNANVLKVKV